MAAFLIVLLLLSTLFWLVGEMTTPTIPLERRLDLHVHHSDDEYLSHMPDGISDEVALKIRRILVEVSGFEPDEVWPDTSLVELLE